MELKSNLSIFFNDIVNLFRGGRVLGIDIGTVSIKAVELSRRGGDIVLDNYGILSTKGYLERGNEAIQTSSLKLAEGEVLPLLRTVLNEMKPKTKLAFASLPSFATFTTTFEMPLIAAAETAKAVNFQARQYIPLPISEVTVEWVKTAEFENERGQRYQRILITAVPKELIRKYKGLFRKAGLTLTAVEMEDFSLTRILTGGETPPTMILDIGAESTSVTVAEKGILQYSGQTDYAGASLTQAVARSLGISASRAEELKRRRGLSGTAGEYELSTSIVPFLDVIIQEGNRLRFDYERIYGKKIQRLILVGGTANLPGIGRYISSQMNLVLNEPLPFTNIKYRTDLEPVVKDLSRTLAVATGVAIKGLL